MADERPITPPLRKPVSTFPTPSHVVSMYTELVNRDDPAYKANAPVKRGSIYSTMVGAKPEVIAQFPLLYFLRERQFQGDDQKVFWDWINDEAAHDTYNSTDTYAFESINHPGFQREYTIRRDEYNDEPAIALGLPLNTLTAVRIVDGGGNYTSATGTITGTTVRIDFVVLDGVIISGVVTDQGEGILGTAEITVTGDGGGAIVEPIVQSTAAVLVGQKKVELDPQDPLQHEFIKIVRIYATLPGPTINSTEIDEDGIVVNVATTLKVATQIVCGETLLAGTWSRTTQQQQDNVYTANEIVKTRVVPGNPIPETRLDKDGVEVDIVRTLKDTTTIVTQESFVGNIWTKTTKEPLSQRLTTDTVSDLVSWEMVEGRVVPGNIIPSARVGEDHETDTVQKILKNQSTIVPGATESGGTLTIVEKEEVTDLVANEVTSTKTWLDRAVYSQRLPESIIPVEFRASIPTVTESHTVVGIASMPTLTGSQIFTLEQQLTKIFKEVRTESLGLNLAFPIIQIGYETTEQYGGGILSVTRTLNNSALSAEEGEDVVNSVVNPIGTNLMWIRETRRRYIDAAWPIILGTHIDEKYYLKVGIQRQVVNAGATGSASGNTVIEVRPIDKWRSIQITSTLDVNNLPAPVQWFDSMQHSFPPELTDAVIDWAEATCGCSDSFSAVLIANITQYSGVVTTRITETFYNGPPPNDIVIYQTHPQSHHFGFAWASFCGTTDGDCRTKSGAPEFHIPLCLHGDLSLTVGALPAWVFPATTPSVLPHGSYITLAPHVERWRFGVFRRVITEVLVP